MPSQPEQLYQGEEAQEINPKIDADYLFKKKEKDFNVLRPWLLE